MFWGGKNMKVCLKKFLHTTNCQIYQFFQPNKSIGWNMDLVVFIETNFEFLLVAWKKYRNPYALYFIVSLECLGYLRCAGSFSAGACTSKCGGKSADYISDITKKHREWSASHLCILFPCLCSKPSYPTPHYLQA